MRCSSCRLINRGSTNVAQFPSDIIGAPEEFSTLIERLCLKVDSVRQDPEIGRRRPRLLTHFVAHLRSAVNVPRMPSALEAALTSDELAGPSAAGSTYTVPATPFKIMRLSTILAPRVLNSVSARSHEERAHRTRSLVDISVLWPSIASRRPHGRFNPEIDDLRALRRAHK